MITIRKAKADDAPVCWEIRRDAILACCTGHYPEESLKKWTSGGTPASFPEMVENDFFLAIVEGDIAGTGMIDLESGKVDGVFVAPAHARIGVGSELMDFLEKIAREAGLEEMHLDSTVNAADFYRACGFTGCKKTSWRSARGFDLDCIPMRKELGPSPLVLRTMKTADLAEVADLGIRSKAHWGYSADEMEIFAEELTLSETDLKALAHARVAIVDDLLVGYVTLRQHADGVMELEHLFVSPNRFRQGIGTALLKAALGSSQDAGAETVMILSDPNATEFYMRQGATVVGEHQSSIAGRSIPILSMPAVSSI